MRHWSGRHSHTPSLHSEPAPHTAPPGPQLHTPPTQRSAIPVGHPAHKLPPIPHAPSVGTMHGPAGPAQHPSGHELPLHTHAPPTHANPSVHFGPFPHRQLPAALQWSLRPTVQLVHATPLMPQTTAPPSVTFPCVWSVHTFP